MKLKSILLCSIFSASSLLAEHAVQAAEIRCDSCKTEASAATAARNFGVGLHYVFSVSAGTVFRYQVEREPNNIGTYDWFVFQEAVEPDVAKLVSDFNRIYVETGGTMYANFTIHADSDLPLGSAHPAVRPGADQTRLFNWLLSSAAYSFQNFLPLEGAIFHSMAAALISIFKQVPLQTHVTIVFPDGSKITLTYEQWNNTVAVVPNTAQDALGNPIPASLEEAAGIAFNFGGDPTGAAAGRMSNWLERLGAQMQGTGSNTIACVTAAGKTTCTRF